MLHLIPSPAPSTEPCLVPEEFACEVRFSGRDEAWVRVCGELDLAHAHRFAQSLARALSGAQVVVVDLRQLTFIDSTGLHILTEADARARCSHRRLVLVRGSVQVQRVFDVIGLSAQLEMIDLRPVLVGSGADPGPVRPNVAR